MSIDWAHAMTRTQVNIMLVALAGLLAVVAVQAKTCCHECALKGQTIYGTEATNYMIRCGPMAAQDTDAYIVDRRFLQ